MTRSRIAILAGDTFRTLVSRRANVAIAVLLFGLLTVASCSLQMTGTTVVNGQVLPIGPEERIGIAVGTTFAGLHFFGALLVIFILVPALSSEIESGLAAWVLVKPIRRETYLIGRLLGAFLFLAAFLAVGLVGLEVLLVRYAGGPRPEALLGWAALALLAAAYLAWGVLFALHFGSGLGGLALFLLALSGAVIDFDPLTRYFLSPAEGAPQGGFLDALFFALRHGEGPPAAARVLYGALYAIFPGTGNVHDLAVALATGRPLGISMDHVSLPIVAVGVPVALLVARRALARREL